MGTIEDVAALFTVQTAVYWGPGTPDGEGGRVWPDPVEIDCRWDEVTKLVVSGQTSGKPGEEVVAHATVLVNIDLKYGGFLFLGDLDDLGSAEEENPMTVSGAHRIIRWEKIPMVFETDDFVRMAYLGA